PPRGEPLPDAMRPHPPLLSCPATLAAPRPACPPVPSLLARPWARYGASGRPGARVAPGRTPSATRGIVAPLALVRAGLDAPIAMLVARRPVVPPPGRHRGRPDDELDVGLRAHREEVVQPAIPRRLCPQRRVGAELLAG